MSADRTYGKLLAERLRDFRRDIAQRPANLRPILFTANASGEALQSMMSEDRGEPIIRRLREFCEVVVL